MGQVFWVGKAKWWKLWGLDQIPWGGMERYQYLREMGGRIGLWMDGIEKRCMDFYGHNDGLRMVSWDGWDLSGG